MIVVVAALFILFALSDAFIHRLAPFHPSPFNDKAALLSKGKY